MSRSYFALRHYDQASEFSEKSLSIAEKLKNPILTLQSLQLLAVSYQHDGAEAEALATNEKLLELSKMMNHFKGKQISQKFFENFLRKDVIFRGCHFDIRFCIENFLRIFCRSNTSTCQYIKHRN